MKMGSSSEKRGPGMGPVWFVRCALSAFNGERMFFFFFLECVHAVNGLFFRRHSEFSIFPHGGDLHDQRRV